MEGLGPTLLLALVAALALGAVAHRLGLPLMIGYILAGLVVGPVTPGPTADREEILALADIGVALLMFSIGLQFSISEIRSVGARIREVAPAPHPVVVVQEQGLGDGEQVDQRLRLVGRGRHHLHQGVLRDEVLEQNAEEFVRSYIQKGGE